MIKRFLCLVLMFCFLFACSVAQAEDNEEEIFSGPQPGEKLVPFKMRGVFDDSAGKDIDIVAQADGKPVLLVFFHKKTRPAFGLANSVMRYAAKRSKDGLHSGVVFLTDDATETENWMKVVRRHFATGPLYGISLDGVEGPGAYGLNRNVTLTVLVAKDGKVTANFALVQPSLQADGPKIGKALADVLGGKPPTVAELGGGRYNQPARMVRDEKLEPLIRAVLRKDADEDAVKKAVSAVEAYLKEKPPAKRDLGNWARQISTSDRFRNLGTPAARQSIKTWSKEYGVAARPTQPAVNLRPLLGPLINKSASKEEVDKAAVNVEQVAAKNAAVRKRIGEVARQIIAAGKLENYGTPAAQEYLSKWAKQFKPANGRPDDRRRK